MQANDPDRNAMTAFSFDIINPHPYLAANVLLRYSNIRGNDSDEPFEQTIKVKPNSFLAVSLLFFGKLTIVWEEKHPESEIILMNRTCQPGTFTVMI